MKVGDMICVADFCDLFSRQSLRGLRCKVGIIKFGLKQENVRDFNENQGSGTEKNLVRES